MASQTNKWTYKPKGENYITPWHKCQGYNNTAPQMQDSIYHMTLKSHLKISPLENATFMDVKLYQIQVICIFNQTVDYCF